MAVFREELAEAQHMGASDAAWSNFGPKSRHFIALALCVMLIIAIIWAAWAEIDEVTRAQGQVIPSQRVQIIQHLEGGILVDVPVKEGQTVEADQVLAKVDNVGASSVLRDTQTRVQEHEAAIARLEAEIEGREPVFNEMLSKSNPQLVESERNTYTIRNRQHIEEMNVLDSQIQQRKQELQEGLSRKTALGETLGLVEQRVQRIKPLMQRKLYSEVDYLNLQQEVVRLKGEIDALLNTISKTETAIKETEQRKDLSLATWRSELTKELNIRKSEMASLKENLIANFDRVQRTDLRSPVRGIVKRLLITTLGGIVKPGGEIMEVIPLDDNLLIEAKVRPADIAFIHPGQKAVVKITAYDSSIYGNLDAVVEQIGADTITEQPKGDVFYLIKVRTEQNSIRHKGQELPITPGMVASVDILTGKKTILNYLLKPILKARDAALRER